MEKKCAVSARNVGKKIPLRRPEGRELGIITREFRWRFQHMQNTIHTPPSARLVPGTVCGIVRNMVRMRTTKGKRNTRRSHHGTTLPGHTRENGVARLRHRASRITGVYRGRNVIDTAKRESRLMRRKSADTGEEQRTEEQASLPASGA